MSIVDQIVDKTQFTEEIDGLEFKLRIITAQAAAQIIGSKVLGLARSSGKSGDVPDGEAKRIAEGYLKLCMVSPMLGDTSDAKEDKVCLEDLGGYADKILMAVFKRSGFEGLGNSQGSSEVTEAETSAKP